MTAFPPALLFVFALTLAGCSNMVAIPSGAPMEDSAATDDWPEKGDDGEDAGMDEVFEEELDEALAGSVQQTIYRQYERWRGTRYRAGGLDKSGLDCSGLVYLTFRDEFGMKLPRTAEGMARLGSPVPQPELQAGDLVFFKIGSRTRHVGIYLDDSQFLHVSSSRGVMISRLQDYYWRDRYWQARRVR